MNEYIDGIMSKVDMDAIKKSQLKVAFDPHVRGQQDGVKHHFDLRAL